MPMKTWMLEKAPILNDGTQGEWEISRYGREGNPEVWHSYEAAVESADRRDLEGLDDCYWRVADDE